MNIHETIKIFNGEQEILKLPIKRKKVSSLEMSKLVRHLVFDDIIDNSKFCFLNFSFFLEKEEFIFSQIQGNKGFHSLLYHLVVPQFIDIDFETEYSDFQIIDFNGEPISPLPEELKKRHRYGFRTHALRKYIFFNDDSLIKEWHKKDIENASIEIIKKYFLTERFQSIYFSNFYFENEKVFDLYNEDDFFGHLKKLLNEKCQGLEKIFLKGFNSFSSEYIYYGKHHYDLEDGDGSEDYQRFDTLFLSFIKEVSREIGSEFFLIS